MAVKQDQVADQVARVHIFCSHKTYIAISDDAPSTAPEITMRSLFTGDTIAMASVCGEAEIRKWNLRRGPP